MCYPFRERKPPQRGPTGTIRRSRVANDWSKNAGHDRCPSKLVAVTIPSRRHAPVRRVERVRGSRNRSTCVINRHRRCAHATARPNSRRESLENSTGRPCYLLPTANDRGQSHAETNGQQPVEITANPQPTAEEPDIMTAD